MNHWIAFEHRGKFYVALMDEEESPIRTHPIPFESAREAERAVARLNVQKAG